MTRSIWCWGAGLMLVLSAMLAASLGSGSGLAWEQAVEWAKQGRAARTARCAALPAFAGATLAGSAYDGYVDALRNAPLPDDAYERLAALVGREPAGGTASARDGGRPRTAADEALLVALAPVVRDLRAATRRSDRAVPMPVGDLELDTLAVLPVFDALLVEALDRAALGELRECVSCLRDGLRFGADLTGAATLVEWMLGATVVDRSCAVLTDELLRRFDAEQLAALAAVLEVVDARLPRPDDVLRLEAIGFVEWLRSDAEVEALRLGIASRLQAWRTWFSVRDFGRARIAEYVSLLRACERDLQALGDSWQLRRPRLARLQADLDQLFDDWFLTPARQVCTIEQNLRETAVRLRLLRLAVAFHRVEPLPELDDALAAGALRAGCDGDRAAFASVAPGFEREAQRRER